MRRVDRIGVVLAGLGLLLAVVGTFLPWLRSGSVLRDSYQAASVLRRLLGLDEHPVGAVIAAWPAIGPAAALCVVGYVVGLRRSAAAITLFLGMVTGTAAGLAIVQADTEGSPVGAMVTGPAVTLFGAAVTVLGACAVLAASGQRHSKAIVQEGQI